MSAQTRAQLMEAATISTTILQQRARPKGFNLGINMGSFAGASIPAHLHMHVLPRYAGDTNFLPILAETKVISIDLIKMYEDLKPHFDAVEL
jgi:ATP adenylyltransferase